MQTYNIYSYYYFIFKKCLDSHYCESPESLKNRLKGKIAYYKDRRAGEGIEGYREIIEVVNKNLYLFSDNYRRNLFSILSSKGFKKIIILARLLPTSRLAINTAGGFGKEVLEVGINIHPIYSVPFIPGSSIKGAFRRALNKVAGFIVSDDEESKKALELVLLGSTTDSEGVSYEKLKEYLTNVKINDNEEKTIENMVGQLIFLDAFPYQIAINNNDIVDVKIPENVLILDIVNKHYDEDRYFSDEFLESGEYISPNPVLFYAIRENTPFTFIMLIKENVWSNDKIKLSILATLEYMFKIVGLGAKTTYGYGRFNIEKIWII